MRLVRVRIGMWGSELFNMGLNSGRSQRNRLGDVVWGKCHQCGFCFLSRLLSSRGLGHSLLCCCLVAKSHLTLCDPTACSTPGFPVLHHLPEFTKTHVHGVGDAIQPSHPLSSPSPPALSLSQHQGLLQWVGPWHQVAKVLELQLQHQSFQWIFRVGFL